MSEHDIVRQHIEAFNQRDEAAEPWSADAELVAPGAAVQGRGQVLGFLRVFHEALPDGRLELLSLFGEGPLLAAEGRFVGTHTGILRSPAGDVEATGRAVAFRWAAIYRATESELQSEHLYFDQVELLSQLGLLPD